MTQSPNDQGVMHHLLHALFGSHRFKYDDNYYDPNGSQWIALKEILQNLMDPASFKTFWKVLCYSGR